MSPVLQLGRLFGAARHNLRPAFRFFTATLKSFFLYHLITTRFYSSGLTWGPSMLPTFEVIRDNVVIDHWYRRGRGITVGDVVQFESVYEPGGKVIKRVIGLEGDYVLMNTPGCERDTMLQVPQGHCWLIGDNLPFSQDSRHLGPIPMALIQGKIIAKISPWKERKWVVNNLKPIGEE